MAVPTFNIKQNDDRPLLDAFLRDDRDRPVDLTGATVLFHMRLATDNSVKINGGSVTVVAATAGSVRYTFTTSNTDTAGIYEAEFQVTFSDGTVQTFPNDGYITIVITDDVV